MTKRKRVKRKLINARLTSSFELLNIKELIITSVLSIATIFLIPKKLFSFEEFNELVLIAIISGLVCILFFLLRNNQRVLTNNVVIYMLIYTVAKIRMNFLETLCVSLSAVIMYNIIRLISLKLNKNA